MHLLVPQGIGDIYWTYQLLRPLADARKIPLHFHIAAIAGHDNTGDKVVQRARPWVSQWPGVAHVDYHEIPSPRYHWLATQAADPFCMSNVIEAYLEGHGRISEDPIPVAANGWLESGRRLEGLGAPEWNPKLTLAPGFDFNLALEQLDPDDRLVAIYLSGTSDMAHPQSLGCWSAHQWAELWRTLRARLPYDLDDTLVAFVGAHYDHAFMRRFEDIARVRRATWVIDRDPAEVLRVLHRADLFIGFQSGLNIMADALDTASQIMLYYPHLNDMMPTWTKPTSERQRPALHHPATFATRPEQVAEEYAAALAERERAGVR